jgi:hypothetical protein
MTADAMPREVDAKSGIGLKSQARRMLRIGTTVPLSAQATGLEPGIADPASAMVTGTTQRARVEIVNDILSIIPFDKLYKPWSNGESSLTWDAPM